MKAAIDALDKEALTTDDEKGALDVLYNLNGGLEYNYYLFGTNVADSISKMYDQEYISTDKTFWGTDTMPPVVYVGETTHDLSKAAAAEKTVDFKAAANVYQNALDETLKNIKTYSDKEIKDMAEVTKLMK